MTTIDQELETMEEILVKLLALDKPTRMRVLRWLTARIEAEEAQKC